MMAAVSDRLTIKAALLLGFGLTLGLWAWTGYDFLQRMATLQQEGAAINLRYMHAQELLATLRPQVLIISVRARTALLDPEPGNREAHRARVRLALQTVHDILQRYVPVLNSTVERERVERLRREIQVYGSAVLEVMADNRPVTAAEVRDRLARIVPRRELVIGVTDEVQALNRAAFVEEQTTIATAHREMQTRVWTRLGLSLLGSLGIALLAALYAGRLENRLRRQREQEVQNTRDLQRLSARLVDVQEQERRIIARELHDELGQVLEAITMELALVERKLHAQGAGDLLRDAQGITQAALHTVRDLSHLLHPAVLDDLGLVAALETYLRTFGPRHAIRTHFVQDGVATRIGTDTEIAAYRIAQEALTNIAKHAHATECTVTVRQRPATLSVAVADNGCGFEAAAMEMAGAAAGLGLIGVRERVMQLGGRLQVESRPGRGTIVTVDLPIGRDEPTPAASAGPVPLLVDANLKAGVARG
jgi:signal transduction histidine kinase